MKRLVILTTHFGSNFSGGSLATIQIFSRIQDHFSQIVVIGKELGSHPFVNLKFIRYKNWIHAISNIRLFNTSDCVFYGDFYNSILFFVSKRPFYFTYHDNWPELSRLDFRHRLLSLFYTNIYRLIFISAEYVFTVSHFKKKYIHRFTDKIAVVGNGINQKDLTNPKVERKNILMVGNIDERKYKIALKLFRSLGNVYPYEIDIYGNVVNENLAKKLNQFKYVNIKGFKDVIPYENYKMLLHTSFVESFGMVFIEASFHKTPVVAFNVGGIGEVIGEENGLLVEPYNLAMMKKGIENIMDEVSSFDYKDQSLDEYSWDVASQRYLEVLL